MSRPRSMVLLLATLAGAAGLFVFWPCIHNSFLHWDDIAAYLGPITQLGSLGLRSLRWAFTQSATMAGYYHPLTWLSLMLDYQLWGLRPLPYHAVNVFLHVLNAFVLVVYLERLLRVVTFLSEPERYATILATVVVFAIHPLQVESVAWIAERKTLLCATFVIASLYAHVRLAEQPASGVWLSAMNGWFLLALLSKPMAIPLPVILLALDWYPLRRISTVGWGRLLKEKLPMFFLSVLAAGATFFTQSQQGAIDMDWDIIDRALMVARSLIFYLWKLAWPAWLSPFYPMSEEVSVRNVEYAVPLLLCVATVAVALRYRRQLPSLAAAFSIYGLFLAPVSGVIPLGGYAVADRYAYLAVVPVLLLIAAATVFLWRHIGRLARGALVALISCQILFYACTARSQIGVWRNDETLWSAVLLHYPNFALANCQLAAALIDQGRFEQASVFAKRATELSPGFSEARATAGLIDLKLRHYDDAVKQLSEAIEANPTLLTAHYNLACAFARLGRLSDAYDLLQELIAMHPKYAALAKRDGELTALRNDPRYAARFAELVAGQSGSK